MLKQLVDDYKQGRQIPKCQFKAKILLHEEDYVPTFQHRLILKGAKEPLNTLVIDIDPPVLTPGNIQNHDIVVFSVAMWKILLQKIFLWSIAAVKN